MANKNRISFFIHNEENYAHIIEDLMRSTHSLSNQNFRLQIINDIFQSKLESKNILM